MVGQGPAVIIRCAVTKFKGLAWLSYDQQFPYRASSNLSLQWDKVDLELWTVTFSGLAKPHCSICLSPYHTEDVCPSTDPNRKVSFPDGVLWLQQVLRVPVPKLQLPTRVPPLPLKQPQHPRLATASKTALSNNPVAQPRMQEQESPDLMREARSKVEQQRRHQKPLVSSPIDFYRLDLELTDHPDRNFVFNC